MFSAGNPVDSWVSSDSLVVWIYQDNFVEFEGSVLSNPVRVKNSEISASLSNSVFSNGSVGSCWFQLVDTLVDWLSVYNTFLGKSLSATSSNSDSVDDISLGSLVTNLSCLFGSWWSVNLVDDGKLSVFPWSHSQHESHDIRLLLSPEFFKIFVGSHLSCDII